MEPSGPDSMMQILEQCKTMERHLTAILMECLLKLSSATSTGVFILVEDAVDGGRRVAGSDKLRTAFKSCSLVPTGVETELFLDDPHPAVYEKPIGISPPHLPASSHQPSFSASFLASDFGHSTSASSPSYAFTAASDLGAIQRLSRKRLSDGYGSGESSNGTGGSNRSKHFKRAYKPTFLPPAALSVTPPVIHSDVVVIKDETREEDSPDNVSFGNSPGLDLKDFDREPADSPSSSAIPADGAESRRPAYDAGADSGESTGGLSANFDANFVGSFQPTSGYEKGPTDATLERRRPVDDDLTSSAAPSNVVNQAFGFDVEKFLMENEKYRAVANIRDPAIMEKSNIANKLLTSLLYDISKCIVVHSPFRENKNKQNSEYFNRVFEIVWEHLPYLNELNETRAKFNGKSPRYYVRHTMQAYYIVLMSKCVSQAQNQTSGYRAIRFLD